MKNRETLERSAPAEAANELRENRGLAAEKIGRSIAYMIEHIDQPLQVAMLATQASVSPSHYFALFKRQTGCPPIDYFIRLRMERARELLESSSSSVKEIAARLGYHDPFYFSRVFKSVNQLSPSLYRQRLRGDSSVRPTKNNGPVQPNCRVGALAP